MSENTQEMTDAKTVQAIQAAAKQGNAQAQWDLAVCYAQGNGVEQDDTTAFSWACKAAENGLEQAAKYVLKAYEKGSEELGIQPDLNKLVEWADKLSAAGSNAGRYYYANLFMSNDNARRQINIKVAYERIREAANEGDIPCMFVAYNIGGLFAAVNFEAYKDYKTAIAILQDVLSWTEKLEQAEFAISDSEKAVDWYLYGQCLLKQNLDSEAVLWFKKAMPWNVNAEMWYGIWLSSEGGRTNNISLFKESASHLLHAVKSEDDNKEKQLEAFAYYTLAKLARNGFGMNVDMDSSYQWMCRAAELGFEDAKNELPRYHKKLFGGYTYK